MISNGFNARDKTLDNPDAYEEGSPMRKSNALEEMKVAYQNDLNVKNEEIRKLKDELYEVKQTQDKTIKTLISKQFA